MIPVNDTSQVTIDGNIVTINPSIELQPNWTYHVEIESGAFTDEAGNAYAGIADDTTLNFSTPFTEVPPESSADSTIVVFDLIQGVSSNHSGRTFDADTSYTIFIHMDSEGETSAPQALGREAATWGRMTRLFWWGRELQWDQVTQRLSPTELTQLLKIGWGRESSHLFRPLS
ncbi:Ig-like domain-containing protein [Comamonas endophytica]|uniref:Ig-like domain-containing protein n=1 Tax=Comamonas endophytica TaxID=2949090 RepID=UPI0036197EF5